VANTNAWEFLDIRHLAGSTGNRDGNTTAFAVREGPAVQERGRKSI
jgi:hypothetical protein